MRTVPRHPRWLALSALLLAAAPGVVSATVPPSTGLAGRHYLLWARGSEARIWELDAAGGVVQERTLSWPARVPGAEAWSARELSMGPDGKLRLLWTNPELGRSVAWQLDAAFSATSETVYQAGNPPLNWYSTDLEKRADGTGRLVWFNGQVGSAVVWGLDEAGNKVSTKHFTPAADLGAWVPIDYSIAPDGTARLVWSYVWNGTGSWGGRSVVWFLDGSDAKIGSQGLAYDPDWYLRSYDFGNDGKLRFLLANDLQGRGKVCTSLTDTTTVPALEGWGPGKCKSFGPERGWILRSYTGNVPLDLSAPERAMIEREADRLGYPPESFLSPTEIRIDDAILSTEQIELGDDVDTLHIERWPEGRLYLEFPQNAPLFFIQNVLDGCRQWGNVAGVSCLSGLHHPRLRVEYASGSACYARYGYQSSGDNYITTDINGWCVPHELGHTLGFVHTHQREDRDDYVRVYEDHVEDDFVYAIMDRFRVEPYGFGPYDYHSLMHYGPYAFAKPGHPPTITRTNGSTDIGGNGNPTVVDRAEMQRIYPGTGTVSPASEFILPPPDGMPVALYVSTVRINGTPYTPGALPTLQTGSHSSLRVVLTNSGRPWLASENLFLTAWSAGAVEVVPPTLVSVAHDVPTGDSLELAFGVWVPSSVGPSAARVDITLFDPEYDPLAHAPVHLYIGSAGIGDTGASKVLAVDAQATVVPPGGSLPFHIRVQNPGLHAETVRVRGYLGGAGVTDAQASFQLRTLEPGQSETFVFSAVAPAAPGLIRAYGQLYRLSGAGPFHGNESGEVEVKAPPSCGGCDFTGVPCGSEGRCVNNPTQGCGVSNVCGTTCAALAEVQQVTVMPDPVPPGALFTVKARVRNLHHNANTFSVRGYTDLAGVTPAEGWLESQTLQTLETRDYSFVFTAPATGSFQAHGQVFCPGAPLPFVGNSSAPVAIDAGGGGPYTGVVPSSTIVAVGPQPAAAGGTISLHARVYNHNSYTTSFYLRPYATAPDFVELPRRFVSILPNSEITELIEFPVPNQPGATLDLHFQAEYTVGEPLSGDSATGVPIGGPNPPPNPMPPPESICPGPNDGDATGCPLDGVGNQSYKTCESCRSAYPAAPGCVQKALLNWCWKPQ